MTTDNSTRSLPHIPLEILRTIADHLDLPSAANLSRTCRALRDAGEVKIWSSVDITSMWDSADPSSADLASIDDYQTRQATVRSKLDHTLSAIRSYPFRQGCITDLRLEPSDKGGPLGAELFNLLQILSAQLKSLSILPLPYDLDWSDAQAAQYGHRKFIGLLSDTADLEFDKVWRFRYACGHEAINSLGSVMDRVKNVRELDFCSAEESFEVPIKASVQWSPSIHLKRLTFNHLDDTAGPNSPRVLARILNHAPELEFLRIMGQWAPRKKDPALQAMEKLSKLKTVISLDEDGIETERFGKVGLVLEQQVVEDDSMDETNELTFENIILARLPNLHRITILTSPRLPLSDYLDLGIGKTPYETGHLSTIFVRYIRRVPQLCTMLFHFLNEPFPSAYNTAYIEPEYFIEPSRWVAEGHRGAIIRQYSPNPGSVTSSSSSNAEGDFIHIRSLSRSLDHATGPAYVGARRCWRDFVHYRGRTVPRQILENVYAAAELPLEFLEGGRNMPLSGDGHEQAAWKVLRDWRETAGDESEVEDDFSDDGGLPEDFETDDDDDVDDEDDEDGDGDEDLQADMLAALAENGVDDDGWVDTDDDGDEDDDDDPLGAW